MEPAEIVWRFGEGPGCDIALWNDRSPIPPGRRPTSIAGSRGAGALFLWSTGKDHYRHLRIHTSEVGDASHEGEVGRSGEGESRCVSDGELAVGASEVRQSGEIARCGHPFRHHTADEDQVAMDVGRPMFMVTAEKVSQIYERDVGSYGGVDGGGFEGDDPKQGSERTEVENSGPNSRHGRRRRARNSSQVIGVRPARRSRSWSSSSGMAAARARARRASSCTDKPSTSARFANRESTSSSTFFTVTSATFSGYRLGFDIATDMVV